MRRTKIVCTIGPSSSDVKTLREMIAAGMNVARLNFSHGSSESNLELLQKIRKASQELKIDVAILQDLQGPKIRVGELGPEGLELLEESQVTLQVGVDEAPHGVVPVPYDRLAQDVSRGDRILLDDGTKEVEVLDVRGKQIVAKVLLGGRLKSRKGLNVPSASLSVEALTAKDLEDLRFGLQHNLDFVALSFVRSAEDVRNLRDKIAEYLPADLESPAIIVKIEKHEALDNFEEILKEADGVMIARGDLGLETPASAVPMRQKELIARCVVAGKPVITATEMLASMEHNPRPTRAETSDVANAVIDHTDALMLSGESAMGRYPVRAVETMANIASDVEESPLDDLAPDYDTRGEPVASAVAAAAVQLAQNVDAVAILATTGSGYSARMAARLRSATPVFAATNSLRVMRQLLLQWGVEPFFVDGYSEPEQMTHDALGILKEKYNISGRVVVMSGLKTEGKFQSAVRVVEI